MVGELADQLEKAITEVQVRSKAEEEGTERKGWKAFSLRKRRSRSTVDDDIGRHLLAEFAIGARSPVRSTVALIRYPPIFNNLHICTSPTDRSICLLLLRCIYKQCTGGMCI